MEKEGTMSNTRFCQKCFDNFMAMQVKRTAGGLSAYVDRRDMVFECRVPRFTHDHNGNPVVFVRNCAAGTTEMISQAEYERRRSSGEL